MRIPPVVPVERIDHSVRTSSNHTTYCRLYHTPQLPAPVVEHPGAPPTPPTPPRSLPRRKKSDNPKSRQSLKKHYNTKVVKYNVALTTYHVEKAEWDEKYEAYVHGLDLDNILCKIEDTDSNDGEEDSQDDPIAAAQPLVVFTHGRNSTLDNAHLTAFCQGFARETPILLFEDTRAELQRIQVFRSLVSNYPSIKAFSGRSAGARNAARASSKTLLPCKYQS